MASGDRHQRRPSADGAGERSSEQGEVDPYADDRILIRALLRQTPQQRLEGLRRSAAFFRAARRV